MKGENAGLKNSDLLGAALLFLESLIFESHSFDTLSLAGYSAISKLKKLGLSEEYAVKLMNIILASADTHRKKNPISSMF